VEEVIPYPSLTLQVQEADWRTPLIDYIKRGVTLEGDKVAKHIISTPLLKCIGPEEVWYVLVEIHEGSYGHHFGAKYLARKSLRAGYFWSTMQEDVANHLKKSEQCQRDSNIPHISPEKLHILSAPWPFIRGGWTSWDPFIKPRDN
jgi:hypothetical protein